MGSVVRQEFKPKSDIDVFIIIDDTEKIIPFEEKAKIDQDIVKIAKEIHPLLSFQPIYTLTEFVDYARICHPIIYNFIKEGDPIYDTGFFTPFKRLLKKGKIPMTREAIESYMDGAPKKLMRAKSVKLLMLAEDCFYAILNTSQGVMMFMGVEPPVPSKAYNQFKECLVKPGIVEEKYADWLKEIIEIRKKIEHKELMDVSGAFVDEWIQKSDQFIKKMYDILSVLESRKKEKVLERTHNVMHKAVTTALKNLNKTPKDEKEVFNTFKKEFIDTNMIERYYVNVWDKVEIMKDLVDKKKGEKIPDKDVYQMREYVRNMIRDLGKILNEKK